MPRKRQTETAAPSGSAGPRPRNLISRVNKGELDRVSAYLPADLGRKLRMTCAGERIEISEAIADAVRAWLAKRS